MAHRYFSTYTQSQLETQLAAAEAELVAGAAIVSGGSGDANYAKQIQASILARIRMIKHDLNILAPATYPANFVNGPTRTQARFNQTGDNLYAG